jgi:hypothetical protein
MAEFTGAHIEMGVALKAGASELFDPIWSETIAANGTTTLAAVAAGSVSSLVAGGLPIFRVRAPTANAIFISRGKAPDTSKAKSTNREDTRIHLAAGEVRDIPCLVGDKLSVVSAA